MKKIKKYFDIALDKTLSNRQYLWLAIYFLGGLLLNLSLRGYYAYVLVVFVVGIYAMRKEYISSHYQYRKIIELGFLGIGLILFTPLIPRIILVVFYGLGIYLRTKI